MMRANAPAILSTSDCATGFTANANAGSALGTAGSSTKLPAVQRVSEVAAAFNLVTAAMSPVTTLPTDSSSLPIGW